MVNSILNNPVILDQLVKAYMTNAASTDATKNEGAEKSHLSDNSKVDEFVGSNGSTESAITKDEVMDILLDMSDAELAALAEDLGVDITSETEDTADVTPEAPKAPEAPATPEAPAVPETPVVEDGKGAADVKEQVEDAEAAADESAKVSDTEAAAAASSTTSTTTADGEESSKIKEEIEELEEKRDKNYKEIEKLEAKIEDLTAKAEQNIMKAAAEQEKKVEEHQEETQKVVEENINAYVEANKNGEGMDRSQLQENIKNGLSDVPEVGNAVAAAIAANDQLNIVDSKLGDLNKLIADTQDIEKQIETKETQYDAAKKSEEAEAKAKEAAKSCDPIGFTMGEGADQVKYDFIVDDGAFDSTSDFLGAEDQWAEMQALDTDGDKIVTAAELEAGNIKAVKTDAEGNQSVVSIAEELGEDFSIDLASYTEGGSHSAVQAGTDHDNDGTVDQELLGTFSMNVNGQSVQGYNTLDDTDWLAQNYGLSAAASETPVATTPEGTDAEGTAPAVTEGLDVNSYSAKLKTHATFFNTFSQKVEDLRAQLKEAWTGVGQTEESLRALNGEAVEEADKEAKEVDETVETETMEKEEATEEVAENGNPAASEEATTTEGLENPEITILSTEEEEQLEKDMELEENFFMAA